MKMKLIRGAALMLAAASLFAFASCSGTKKNPDSTDTGASTSGSAPGTTAPDAPEKMPDATPVDDETNPTDAALRRPITNKSPAWIVHIDTWNYADPEKIVELVPDDIKPYVIFNISMSISWNADEHRWNMVNDGYQLAHSWIKACADKGVWAMIQPASGGQCHFPDYPADYDLEDTLFAEFFRDYPNFLGYNYCEQFWGFDQPDFPTTYQQRYDHFSALLRLCNKYGGYLDVSWCENQWGSALNPIAMLKTNANWEEACRTYPQNFILEEKYTQTGYIADVESEVYGAFISGYCGNYGVRWDDTGWSDYPYTEPETKKQYRLSTSLPVLLERMALCGMTVIDGPELIWNDCISGPHDTTDADGYKVHEWSFFDQCENVYVDFWRKFIDGTIRIPSRKEVIDRTKVLVVQDIISGDNDERFCTYKNLFEGLYRLESDGNLKDNHNPFKRTGRYATIPTVYKLLDDASKTIPLQMNQSDIKKVWSTIEDKVAMFNDMYEEEYSGDIYAGRCDNTWVTYDPYTKTGESASGILNLKYNTCDTLEITHQPYGSALIKEYTNKIEIYMNNFDEDKPSPKQETIRISGAAVEPTLTFTDRSTAQKNCKVSGEWKDGVYTVTVTHNGPVDIVIDCYGTSTAGKAKTYKASAPTVPVQPAFYSGARQYEAESFDIKNVEANVQNGCGQGVDNFYGQGYLKFGKNKTASARDSVSTSKAGEFELSLRYSVTADCTVDVYVNGEAEGTLTLSACADHSDWQTSSLNVTLKEGANTVEFKAVDTLPESLYLDCMTVTGDFGG